MPEYRPDYEYFNQASFPEQRTSISGYRPDGEYFSSGLNNFYLEGDKDNTISEEDDRSAFWDSMPYIYKKAYNDSIGGMAREIMTGKKYYDLADAPAAPMKDLAAAILSFVASKEDLALMAASYGVGNLAAKGAMKGASRLALGAGKAADAAPINRAAAVLVKRTNIGKNLSKKERFEMAKGIVSDTIQTGFIQGSMLGVHDGLYYGAIEARNKALATDYNLEKLEGKSWAEAFGMIMKDIDASKGLAGGFLGLAGGTSRTMRFTKAGKIVGKSGLPWEIGTFTAGAPILYEGRAPGPTDFAIGAGIISALKIPPAMRKRYKAKIKERMTDEVDTNPDARAAIIEDIKKSSSTPVLWEQIMPVATATGRGTTIKGTQIKPVTRKTPDGKEYQGIVLDTKTTVIANNKQIKMTSTIVEGSLKKTKKGYTMDIQVQSGPGGKGTYRLNETNTNKFFDFMIDNEHDWTFINKAMIALKGGGNKVPPLYAKVYRDNIIRNQREKAINGQSYGSGKTKIQYNKKDWENAVQDMLNDIELAKGNKVKKGQPKHKFQRMLDEGRADEITIDMMTPNERWAIANKLNNQVTIRNYVNVNSAVYNTGFMYQTASWGTKGVFSRVMGAFQPFYQQLQSPYARKLVRLIERTKSGVQQKMQERFIDLKNVFDAGKIGYAKGKYSKQTKTWYDEYIDGETKGGVDPEISAFKDYKAIRVQNAALRKEGTDITKEVNGYVTLKNRLEKERTKALRLGNKDEVDRINLRLKFIRRIKNRITNPIYKDAQGAGLRLAPFEEGYSPLTFKKEVFDIIYEHVGSLEKLVTELTEKVGYDPGGQMDEQVLKALNKALNNKLRKWSKSGVKKSQTMAEIWKALRGKKATQWSFKDDFAVFRALDSQMHQRTLRPFLPLEQARVYGRSADVSMNLVETLMKSGDQFLEKNMRRNFGEYVSGATKRIELSRAFTPSGAYFQRLLNRIPADQKLRTFAAPEALGGQSLPLSAGTEREAVDLIKRIFTGEINWDKSTEWTKAFQTVANLEMMGKISLGMATIPNLTQPFISTVVEAGPLTSIKALTRLYGPFADKKLRERIDKSGAAIMDALDEMFGTDPRLATVASRIFGYESLSKKVTAQLMGKEAAGSVGPDIIAWATQRNPGTKIFQGINKFNQVLAAATAEEQIKKMGNILNNKSIGILAFDQFGSMTFDKQKKQRWAKRKLKGMGIDWRDLKKHNELLNNNFNKGFDASGRKRILTKSEKEFERKLMRSMQQFATKSQLQRDFMLDPLLFNDPLVKPLALFKRFGYRQASYMKNTLEYEMINGNIAPALWLGMGGFGGGQFVLWAKDEYGKLLSGEPEYRGKGARMKTLRTPEFQDFLNSISAVGAFGVMSDVATDDNPFGTVGFFLKPVVIDDIQRGFRALDTAMGSMETNYPNQWRVPFQKAAIVAAPIAGSSISRLTRRALETPGSEKDRIRARKRETIVAIREATWSGNSKLIERLVVEFNTTYGGRYPGLMITFDDIGPKSMMKYYADRLKKQRKEVEYRPW